MVTRHDAVLVELATRTNVKFNRYFPTCTPACHPTSLRKEDHSGLCRALYVKHAQFMAAGAIHRERLFMAANRIGKTETVSFEVAAHMTGLYPTWWRGREFDRPVRAWASGDTMLTTRDILQVALLGPVDCVDTRDWRGMLPVHLIVDTTRKSGGVSKCLDQVWVKHVSGGRSILEFKSHDQGRRAFQGTEQDVIVLDEEPPDDVYTECLLRTMTTDGLILCSMTPLQGLTPFVQQYLETATMIDSDGLAQKASEAVWPSGSAA